MNGRWLHSWNTLVLAAGALVTGTAAPALAVPSGRNYAYQGPTLPLHVLVLLVVLVAFAAYLLTPPADDDGPFPADEPAETQE